MAVSLTFDDAEFQKGLSEYINKLGVEKYSEGLQKACLVLEAKAKEVCPVGRTGLLRSSITSQVDGIEGAVGSNLEYAPFVELGTGIYAVNGDGRQTPWFYWDDLNEKFIATVGMKPIPFLENAANVSQDDMLRCFEGLL